MYYSFYLLEEGTDSEGSETARQGEPKSTLSLIVS